jgi:RNA polymerase sigma-70 factor (ECF subfamily)
MRSLLPPLLRKSAHADDINLDLLAKTQAYLVCRYHHRTPDWELIQAWNAFYGTYDPLLRRFARACRVPAAGVDDCVQQVWTELVMKLPDFRYDRRRGRFRSWLYIIVHSKAVDWVRGQTRHPIYRLPPEAASLLCGRDRDAAAEYEQQRKQEEVHQVLSHLRKRVPACSYRVLHLRWLEGRSVHEVAAALGLTPAQVRLRDYRMKRQFHRLFNLHTRSTGDSALEE